MWQALIACPREHVLSAATHVTWSLELRQKIHWKISELGKNARISEFSVYFSSEFQVTCVAALSGQSMGIEPAMMD